MDGTAARRSIVYDSGRVSHLGEYEVRKIAMPSAIGIASTSANSETNTVTWKRSRTPNAIALMFCVTHSRLVRKLTWFRLKAGTARQIRNAPIAAMTTVMKIAEPEASELKMRSPGRVTVLLLPLPGPSPFGGCSVSGALVEVIVSSVVPFGPPTPPPLVAGPGERDVEVMGASLMRAHFLHV